LLDDILKNKIKLDDDATLKKDFKYYNLEFDDVTRQLISYTLNEKKVLKAKKTSGFFAIISNRLNFSPVEVLTAYNLRDEQEKYFQQMKSQMGSDRQRNWSEAGKTGRLLILFVSLILSSYVRYIWKSSDLKKILPSSLAILDKMRSIRCVEHQNRAKVITPFVGAQVEICKAFGFEIPKGCGPLSARPQTKRKRGRPPKTKV
jgi:transposase